jgi:hypothetical protein
MAGPGGTPPTPPTPPPTPQPPPAIDGLIAATIVLGGVAADSLQILGPFGINTWGTYGVTAVLVGAYLLVRELSSSAPWSSVRPGRKTGAVIAAIGVALLSVSVISATSGPAACYRDDMRDPDRGWTVGHTSGGSARHVSAGYDVLPEHGRIVWVVAPSPECSAAVSVTATGRLLSGQGGWGTFCRGDPGDQRYEFSVTHAGAAYIKTTDDGGTGPVPIPDFDAFADNTITAECRDTEGTGGVRLTLRVGDFTISHIEQNRFLGPGRAGVHAFSFGDVDGTPAAVRFTDFAVTNLHS